MKDSTKTFSHTIYNDLQHSNLIRQMMSHAAILEKLNCNWCVVEGIVSTFFLSMEIYISRRLYRTKP